MMNTLREILIPFGIGLTALTVSAVIYGVVIYGV